MAIGHTLATLRQLLRLYIDDRGSTRFSDAELLLFLNEGQGAVQDVIDDADENFFSECAAFSVVSNLDSYEFDLPDNLRKVILVERMGGQQPVPAQYVEFRKRHQDTGWFTPPNYFGLSPSTPRYYLRGNKLGVVNPTESYTLRLWYTYSIPDLVGDGDYSAIPPDYRNLIALAAIPLTKGERVGQSGAMPEELAAEYTQGLEKLRTYIRVRQRQEPRQVNYIPEC